MLAFMLYDAIIVGGGAAGLNAALVLGRARRNVLLYDAGNPRNAVADQMHGFLTRDGERPGALLSLGRAELERYPSVTYRANRVERAQSTPGAFVVQCVDGETVTASRLLLATGVCDALPAISGIADLWGRSVFVCPYCDGWEVRDKRVGVLARGRRAVALAQELRQWTSDLVVFFDGEDDLSADDRCWIREAGCETRIDRVVRLDADGGRIHAVATDDGSATAVDALFLSAPLRQRCPVSLMLGCRVTDDNEIAIDACGRTSVPGCYAAGDAVTYLHQVVLAAASGVRAAIGINDDLTEQQAADTIRSARLRCSLDAKTQ